jgi:hypothetical protein
MVRPLEHKYMCLCMHLKKKEKKKSCLD